MGQLQILLTVFPLRGPVEAGQFLPGGLLIQRRQRIQLLLEAVFIGNGGHIRVVVGVVAYDVSLRRHPADDVRGGFDHVAHHEEGRWSAVLFQRVQNGLGVAVFVAAVKGEINDLLTGVPHIPGVILGEKVRCGIANGGFVLCGKGQPPVIGGGGDGGIAGRGQGGGGAAAQNSHQRQAGQKQQTENLQTFAHGVPPENGFSLVCPEGNPFIPGCETRRKLL